MTKVSLPVLVAEPANALQRSAEIMAHWDVVEKLQQAINEPGPDSPEASTKRLALCGLVEIIHYMS
jgi:hypothetical protein